MASPRSTLPGDDSAPSLDAETGPGVRDVVVAFVTSRSRAASRDESIAVGTERVRVRSSLDTAPLLLPDPPADQPPRGGRRQADRMVLIVARVGRSVMTPTGTVHELDAAIAVVLPAGGES